MLEKLKTRWNLKSNFQVIMVILVFSITGSIAVRIAGPVLHFFNVNRETMNPYVFWPIRILIIFPIYQVMLLVVGTLFGQFKFFWAFQQKTVGRMFKRK